MDLAKWEPIGGLIRWKPTFCGLDEVTGDVARLFERSGLTGRPARRWTPASTHWVPDVDIEETDGEYLIRAEIPEICKEDVKVTVLDGILTLEGERPREKEENGIRYHRTERAHGNFLRTFSLPDDADGSKISVELKDGMLYVHLAKSKTPKPGAIEIPVG